MQRYLFLLLIPVFFTLLSCTKETVRPEGFFDFSSKIKAKNAIETKASTEELAVAQEEKPIEIKKEIAAQGPVLKASKRFNLGYLTFDVADFYSEIIPIETTKDFTRYQFRFYSRTNGFINYLFGWMSHTISVMKVYDNKVVPEKFRTKVVLKKKTREISLDYDSAGKNITFEEVVPPDNRGKRPAVAANLKVNTYDPLSMAIEARRLMIKAIKENNFDTKGKYTYSLPLYDGRRRSDINLELESKRYNGNYHLKITQKPIAGYTDNEWADIRKGERIIDLYIDPQTYWPVTARGESSIGSAKAHFVQNCNMTFEECIKLSDDKK